MREIQHSSLTRRQIALTFLGAGLGIVYLVAAVVFKDEPTLRAVLVGPYGFCIFLWLLGIFLVGDYIERRISRRTNSDRQNG
jgi:hypothetical protein